MGIVDSARKTAYGLFLYTDEHVYDGIMYGCATTTLLEVTRYSCTTTVTITTSGLTVTKPNTSAGSADGQYRAVYKEL